MGGFEGRKRERRNEVISQKKRKNDNGLFRK